MDQIEWIARRNMRHYSALISHSEDSDLKRVVNGLLREEKKKFAPQVAGQSKLVNQG